MEGHNHWTIPGAKPSDVGQDLLLGPFREGRVAPRELPRAQTVAQKADSLSAVLRYYRTALPRTIAAETNGDKPSFRENLKGLAKSAGAMLNSVVVCDVEVSKPEFAEHGGVFGSASHLQPAPTSSLVARNRQRSFEIPQH
jgi:hypothetical protein